MCTGERMDRLLRNRVTGFRYGSLWFKLDSARLTEIMRLIYRQDDGHPVTASSVRCLHQTLLPVNVRVVNVTA